MERRILAELFVEDDRAIEEDLGTIEYVEREAGWMSESGISVGHMRILDDDDPEGAKASDLADKIFNSEENDAEIVWEVVIESALDDEHDVDGRIFSTYQKAKEFFDKCVADEKKSNPLMDSENKVVAESEDYFQIYEGGFYNSNRYEITIVGRMVH